MTSPTVFPMTPLDPHSDAGILRRCLNGSSVDRESVIALLTTRTSDQRLEILTHYHHSYDQDLFKELKSALSGDFQTVILALLTPMPEYLAKEIHRVLTNKGAKERTLIEILCTRDNKSIRAIKEAFHNLYDKSLEDTLMEETSGPFQELLVSLCTCSRDEEENEELALDIAQDLFLAGEGERGTGEAELKHILTCHSYETLRKVFQEYNKIAGKSFGDLLEEEVTGEIFRGMQAVYWSIQNPAIFFAQALNASMVGLGTRDRTLIRLVVSRSEIDMADIKIQYKNLYRRSLEKDIKGDTSGDYKRTLLALIDA